MKPKSGTYTNCKIGSYVLGNCIADEGQSEIYEVKNEPNKVCKIFKKDNDDRAERETKVLTDLNELSHPGIVAIETVFEYKKKRCFFMRRIHGRTLAQRMKENNLPQDLLSLLFMMWRISVAMGIVHGKAISHRDLKPQNIMFDENDAPVIIDFGLTKRGDLETVTIDGGITGTPRYMAPEQFKKQTINGELLDVHALGIIFYEMFYSKWPFGDLSEDAGFYDCIKPIVEEQPLWNSNPLITDNLKKICACALEKNPNNRYSNAQEIADALWKEILEIANAKLQKMTGKAENLETLEKIFDPAWLGKEKSLELWKGKLKELFNCQRIQICYLEKSDLTRRKFLLLGEIELLLPVLHMSHTHNCIFQQAPEYSLQNYVAENGQLQREDYETIEKSFRQIYEWSKSNEIPISLDAKHIDFQETISFSLATANPDSETIDKFLKQFITSTHWLENWQEKRKKPDVKWWNKPFSKNKIISDWEHLDEVWVKKALKENQELSSVDIYLNKKTISLSQKKGYGKKFAYFFAGYFAIMLIFLIKLVSDGHYQLFENNISYDDRQELDEMHQLLEKLGIGNGYDARHKLDGSYQLFENGIIYDDKQKLEWFIGPNKNTSWTDAASWVENLNQQQFGDGWRLPDIEELRSFGSREMENFHPIFKNEHLWVWSGTLCDNYKYNNWGKSDEDDKYYIKGVKEKFVNFGKNFDFTQIEIHLPFACYGQYNNYNNSFFFYAEWYNRSGKYRPGVFGVRSVRRD